MRSVCVHTEEKGAALAGSQKGTGGGQSCPPRPGDAAQSWLGAAAHFRPQARRPVLPVASSRHPSLSQPSPLTPPWTFMRSVHPLVDTPTPSSQP